MREYFLNDMQYAFLMGRNSDAPLCGCSCHIIAEYQALKADIALICQAWEALGKRHIILHSMISEAGEVTFSESQNFMECLKIYDNLALSEQEAETYYQQKTAEIKSRNMDIHSGEIFVLHLFLMPNQYRFCFEGDCIAFDVTSFQILIHDFACLYAGISLPELPDNFHPYEFPAVSAEQKKTDRLYWQEKAPEYGEIPAKNYSIPVHPHFTAHTKTLSSEIFQKLVSIAEQNHTNIEILLLTLFSEAFSKVFETTHFVLNIPILNRKHLPEKYADTAGEYTALLMTDIKINSDLNLKEQLSKITEIYQNDCSHIGISGIKIQKILKKQNHYCDYHITFSSHIGIDMNDSAIHQSIGILQSITTQTPRVLMDSEFFLSDGKLLISLVTPDGVLKKEELLLQKLTALAEKITKENQL